MALLDPRSFEATSNSPEQTHRLGARLGANLPARAIVALRGDMGAGKTTFARGFGDGWDAEPALRSPTFTMVQRHHKMTQQQDDAATQSNGPWLYHVDLYRAQTPADLASIGLRELIEEEDVAVLLIEWPEHAGDMVPESAIQISIRTVNETKRQFLFATRSDETWKVLLAFRKTTFGV